MNKIKFFLQQSRLVDLFAIHTKSLMDVRACFCLFLNISGRAEKERTLRYMNDIIECAFHLYNNFHSLFYIASRKINKRTEIETIQYCQLSNRMVTSPKTLSTSSRACSNNYHNCNLLKKLLSGWSFQLNPPHIKLIFFLSHGDVDFAEENEPREIQSDSYITNEFFYGFAI